MTAIVAIACVIFSVAGSSTWALWRWATGHALINHRDQLERRNY